MNASRLAQNQERSPGSDQSVSLLGQLGNRSPSYGFLRRWGPAIVWSLAIWVFSTERFAGEQTSRILIPLLQWVFPDRPVADLSIYHYYVRKAAHAFEFGVLSFLIFHGMRGGRSRWSWIWAAGSLAIAFCYAALDEVHQLFVSSRDASIHDVLLDTAGAVLGLMIAWLFERSRNKVCTTVMDEGNASDRREPTHAKT